jgi:hypothetical protein
VAAELGARHTVLCVSRRDSQSNLYHQRGGIFEQQFAQNYQDPRNELNIVDTASPSVQRRFYPKDEAFLQIHFDM